MVNCDSVKTLIPLRKMQSLLMPRHQSRAVGTVGQDNPFSPPSILADRSKTFPYKRTWITSPKNILRPSYGPVKAVIRENEFESWFTAWLWEISWDWACATIGSSFSWCTAVAWTSIFNSLAGSTGAPSGPAATGAGAAALVVDSPSESEAETSSILFESLVGLSDFFSDATRCFFSSIRSRSRSEIVKKMYIIGNKNSLN